MAIELRDRNVRTESQVPITVLFKGVEVGFFKADLLVNDRVLVELKANDRLTGVDDQQVLNYLAATKLEVALLLNFGPRPTFKRFVRTNKR